MHGTQKNQDFLTEKTDLKTPQLSELSVDSKAYFSLFSIPP